MDTAIACAFCAQWMYFLMTEHSTKVKENKDLSGNTSRLEVHILWRKHSNTRSTWICKINDDTQLHTHLHNSHTHTHT